MATIPTKVTDVIAYGSPDSVEVKWVAEAASQSFVKGDLVYKDDNTLKITTATGLIYGIAARDASGTTGTMIPVHVIKPDTIVAMTMMSNGTNHTSVASNFDEEYGIHDTANGQWTVDVAVTGANERVSVIEVAPGSAVGDVNATVYVHFLADKLQGYLTTGA